MSKLLEDYKYNDFEQFNKDVVNEGREACIRYGYLTDKEINKYKYFKSNKAVLEAFESNKYTIRRNRVEKIETVEEFIEIFGRPNYLYLTKEEQEERKERLLDIYDIKNDTLFHGQLKRVNPNG
jgi:hypothetical protein